VKDLGEMTRKTARELVQQQGQIWRTEEGYI